MRRWIRSFLGRKLATFCVKGFFDEMNETNAVEREMAEKNPENSIHLAVTTRQREKKKCLHQLRVGTWIAQPEGWPFQFDKFILDFIPCEQK